MPYCARVKPLGLGVEVAVPAVGFKALHLAVGQTPAVGDGHVPLDVPDRAHAGDDGGDRRVAEDVAQRHLRHLVLGDAELGDDGPYPFVDLLLAVAAEVVAPEILLVEGGLGCDAAGQRSFVEGYPHDDADVVLLAGGEELVLGAPFEDVVDHLHRVHDPVSMSLTALWGWWSFMETPKKRILPSPFSSSTASNQSPCPTHSSDQTWNCCTSIASNPRFLRLVSVQSLTYPFGKTSSGCSPDGAGQMRFFGGILVATWTVSSLSLTTWPTSR